MIWGLELHTWEEIMRGSLLAVGGFGLIAGLATWFVVSLQRIQIAEDKKEFDAYKLETSKTIKLADARQKEAEVKLEELKKKMGPRIIDIPKFRKALEDVAAPKTLRIFTSDEASDGPLVESQLAGILAALKWPVTERAPASSQDQFVRMLKQGMRMWSDTDSRVAVISRTRTPQSAALVNALTATLGATYFPTNEDFPSDEVWLLILSKY